MSIIFLVLVAVAVAVVVVVAVAVAVAVASFSDGQLRPTMACNVQVFRARWDIWILHLQSLGFYPCRCHDALISRYTWTLKLVQQTDSMRWVYATFASFGCNLVSKLVDGCRIYKTVKEKPTKGSSLALLASCCRLPKSLVAPLLIFGQTQLSFNLQESKGD